VKSQQYAAIVRFNDLKPRVESRLVLGAGWTVIDRNSQEGWVMLGRPKDFKPKSEDQTAYPHSVIKPSDPPPPWEQPEFKSVDGIPDYRVKELNRRCQRIVNCFQNPEENNRHIRTQIHNMGQSLNSIEQEYVENWCFQYVL
jgi:hypothetical protein